MRIFKILINENVTQILCFVIGEVDLQFAIVITGRVFIAGGGHIQMFLIGIVFL